MSACLILETVSPEETQALGEILGRLAQAGEVIALCGELGAGKTCLAQGLGRGLGVTVPVVSPTFVLAREYHGRLPLWHLDAYRLGSEEEAEESGLTDYLPGEGVTVVEWADKIAGLLPEDRLTIRLTFFGSGRRLEVRGPADRLAALAAQWETG